jgi:serine protease Do
VVGINTAIFTRSGGYMGIGFAIPINMARAIQEQLVTTGRVVRGFLGVVIQDVTEDLAESFALPGPGGALLAEVVAASPAAKAGLQPGDVFVAFNRTTVQDGEQLRYLVAQSPPGTLVTVTLIRNGEPQDITVTIEELPPESLAREAEIAEQAQLGLVVQDMTDELAEQFGYNMNTGVVIAQVEPDSPADRAGLRSSMLVRQANRQPISNVRDFQQALAKLDSIKRVLLLVQDEQASRFVVLHLD